MKIKFKISKLSTILAAALLALGLIAFFTIGYKIWTLFIFVAAAFLICCIEIDGDLNQRIAWAWAGIVLVGGATLSTYMAQYVILTAEDYVKTSDSKIFLNVLCALVVYLFVYAIFNNTGVTASVASIALLLFAFVDYFVYQFRGNEVTYADFRAAGTGLSVASQYSFTLCDRCVYVLMGCILYIIIAQRFSVKLEQKIIARVIAVLLLILACIYVAYNSINTNTETWEQKGTYRNGYFLNFVLGIRDSFVSAPDGYSTDAVAELESQYSSSEDDASGTGVNDTSVKDPTVIVIMNESFSDLSVIGDFETNIDVMPFYDSLTENTTKGYALSSVYGAKTPNSEWEYLSGNSMAFLPDGSVVYQQYISKTPTTLVSTLKNDGYTCVAMHPYYSTGWSRNKVYPNIGFDETHFIDDFDQTNILREYITDQELYDKIIDRYEDSSEDEKLFIMGITMQNHGGYTTTYDNFDEDVYKIGTSYTDANQYLSLIRESDEALENLITYFQDVDDPVEIVFFGDHQPGLYSKFYTLLNGKGLSGLTIDQLEDLYTVPFLIWTNYDTEEENVDITSLNYLSTLTLERGNFELPAYNQFLADLMEEIPAINSRGYYSKSLGGFRHIDEATGQEAEWISKYNILQYNSMFDKKNRSSLFFPYIEGAGE